MLKVIVAIIPVLVATVILIFFMQGASQTIQEIDHELISCAEQIKNHARFVNLAHQDRLGLIDGTAAPNIKCPTQRRTFSGSEQAILEQIANNMKGCHQLWDGGDQLLFTEDGTYCHVCTLAQIESERTIRGLDEFLFSNPRTGLTYAEQLTGAATSEQIVQSLTEIEQTGDRIEPGELHATIFFYVRGEDQINAFFTKIDESTAVRGGIISAGTAARFVVCAGLFKACIGRTLIISGITVLSDWLTNERPQFASAIFFMEWNEETVRELGCEFSFVEQTRE